MSKKGEFYSVEGVADFLVLGLISSITTMGQTVVILSDPQLAFDLLDKRSLKHSSRPSQTFIGEMYVTLECLADSWKALTGRKGRSRAYHWHGRL